MSLPIIIALLTTLTFGITAVLLSLREEKTKQLLLERDEQQKQRLFEITILKEIQERIGYSLDVEKAIDVITGSLDGLLQYSVVSSLIIQDERLVFKSHFTAAVSHSYIETIKNSMLASLRILSPVLPTTIDESFSGSVLDDLNKEQPQSFFHIPFVVNNKVVGLITISSTQKNFYDEQRVTFLYTIANNASQTLSRLEDLLKIEEGKLLAMVGSLADGIFMVDNKRQLTIINHAAKAFLGITKTNPTIIDVLSALPNTYDFGGKIQQCIQENIALKERNITLGNRNFDIIINPVLDLHQQPGHMVIGGSVLIHDITIEQSVAKMKEDFTNVIVHELRSPLTSIKASTQLLTSQQASLTPDEKQKLIQMIFTQSNNLLDEVSLILDAAKLEAGLFRITKTHSDLKKLIQDHVAIFAPAAQEKFITLKMNVDPTIPNFSFDEMHVGQVLNNLISNSLKFVPSGGQITIDAKKIEKQVQVSVSDNGPGIPKEKHHLLFSKFSQLTSSKNHPGTGLGLYIVKGVVEAHGGQIKLDSQEGHGTTIAFTLPIETSLLATEAEEPFLPDSHHLIN